MPTEQTDQQPVKRHALSMWQPFASLLASGIKTVDSRSRNTNFRGEFYIHASQAIPRIVYDDYYLLKPTFRIFVNRFLHVEENARLSLSDLRQGFTLGAIIGKACLSGSMRSEVLKSIFERDGRGHRWTDEESLGDHGPGRWAWPVDSPEILPPTPIKGRQMLFWPVPENCLILP